MAFLKSVFFGSEGTYHILGIEVRFEKELPAHYPDLNLDGAGFISKIASRCITSKPFCWISHAYSHVFAHEMSHALAVKAVVNQTSQVHVNTELSIGGTTYPRELREAASWKKALVSVSGPMGNVAYCTCKLVAATALKDYLTWPVSVVLGGGAVMWMSGELLYAYTSATYGTRGDFGQIASLGNTHLALASAALVGECALGVFAAIKLAS